MLKTPAVLQSKLDALNLTQIIKEPTRYNPKSVNMGTLIDIMLTNLPSKYTSAAPHRKSCSGNRLCTLGFVGAKTPLALNFVVELFLIGEVLQYLIRNSVGTDIIN